jgi:hypothetical protein
MKGQDTFGPMGPYIVPKEFYGDPMTRLKQTLLVGTDQRQQSDASDMIHSVGEVIEYASSLVTLQPGDVIGAGTSGGVGMGTSVRGQQVWLVDGDEITATIDGLGTLRRREPVRTCRRFPAIGVAGGPLPQRRRPLRPAEAPGHKNERGVSAHYGAVVRNGTSGVNHCVAAGRSSTTGTTVRGGLTQRA